ncbi:MAG: cell division protein FtsA [bacterium]
MARAHIVAGLDIGTNTIKLLVAQKNKDQDELEILDQGYEPASGVRKGVVVSVEQVSTIISSCIRKSEERLGLKISSVYVNVDGSHVFTTSSHGLISVSRADQKISQEDVSRVVQNAQTFSLPSNREILNVFPREYAIDGERGIKEPVGMQGVRLEAEILVLGGFSPYIKNLTQAVLGADLQINDLILSPLASARAILTEKDKELGVAVLDIGAGTSSLAVYEEGSLVHTAIFPLGSNHITHDIAIGLMTEIEIAEQIKLEYGCCVAKKGARKPTVRLEKIGGETLAQPVSFSRKVLTEIIEARVSDILEQTNRELRKISRVRMLPAGVILTGGGAKMSKITDLAKKVLKLPVRIGTPQGFFTAVEDPALATVCGLVLIGADSEGDEGSGLLSLTRGIGDRLKSFFKVFIP